MTSDFKVCVCPEILAFFHLLYLKSICPPGLYIFKHPIYVTLYLEF